MRVFVAALLAGGCLLGVVNGTRLAEEPVGTGPPNVAETLHSNSPRKTRRTRWWKSPKLLPLVVAASPVAGASLFGFSVGPRFRWPRWLAKDRERPSSLGSVISVPPSASASPGTAPARPEDGGLLTGDMRLGWVLPMALALRGGAERRRGDQEPEPDDHSAQGPPTADPAADRIEELPIFAVTYDEFRVLLLKGAWKATIRKDQTLWIEFVQQGGVMYADVTFGDPPNDEFELVKVLPVILSGRFIGFGGASPGGFLYYHFSYAGEDLRVDLKYPSSFWNGRDQLISFAAPVPRRGRSVSTSLAPVSTLTQEKLILSIERLRGKDEEIPTHEDTALLLRELTILLKKPGHWIGRAPLTGATHLDEIKFKFTPMTYSFELTFSFEYRNRTVMDIVEVHPWDTGDYATNVERTPGYIFTAAGESLRVEIVDNTDQIKRRVQTYLEHELVPGAWSVGALYAPRRKDDDAEGPSHRRDETA